MWHLSCLIILLQVLASLIQEQHWHVGTSSVENDEDGHGTAECVLWGDAQSCSASKREEKLGGTYCCIQISNGNMWRKWIEILLRDAQWKEKRAIGIKFYLITIMYIYILYYYILYYIYIYNTYYRIHIYILIWSWLDFDIEDHRGCGLFLSGNIQNLCGQDAE